MALQAASLLPATISIHKEPKSNASLKETSLYGVSISTHFRTEFSSPLALSKELRKKELTAGIIRAQTTATTPSVDQAASEGKKTLRKDNFRRSGRPLDVLVCNAAVYLPTAKEPTYTAEGFELSVGTNHLGHFLLARLLLDDLKQSDYPYKRLIIVGSITGNTNTLAGNVPPKANLGDLRGLVRGLNGLESSPMIDGGDFDGAKAYKDSKVCNMLTMQEFHRRYHEETGITFASLYPGCIATTGLFREHIPLFRLLFPPFQKYITKGYVSEEEAGRRLAQVSLNSLTEKKKSSLDVHMYGC
ncbi:hypothetical protein DITRI_Ditri01bG0118500 [Diplodiscus trichospermus]